MKRYLTSFLLIAVLSVSLAQAQPRPNDCWDGTVAEAYAGGDGTPENPYQIATPQQLALLAQQTNTGHGGDAYYILTDDICLNSDLNVNPLNWIPIGHVVDSVPCFFTGHFEGNKMTISGLYYDSPTNDEVVGLFGCTNDAEIQNISLTNCRLTGSRYAGTLVGCAGLTDISGCYVNEASVTCEARSAGGMVGFMGLPYGVSQNSLDTCHIVDCHAEQDVAVYGRLAGGLVGEITEYLLWGTSVPSVVSNCSSNTVVMGSEAVGSLVGFMRNGRLESCQCWNEVHCSKWAGGMVGLGVNVNFNDCQNGASVTGNYQSGGMVGKLYGGNMLNCENHGWIYGGGAGGISKIGGMVGRFEPDPLLGGSPCENFIRNCHNYGEITGSNDEAGGIVGFATGGGIEKLFVVDCSNSGMVVENAYLAGGILGSSNGYVMRILNVYNTATVGARIGVGGIVGELSLSQDRVVNAYSTGELIHEIDNYVCPRGSIVGYASTNEQFSSCYWLATDEYGSNGQGPELDNSSAFVPTASSSVWQLETPIHNTQDLLNALNAGAEEVENAFPALGEVSRWREDTQMCNGGFPLFGNQWPWNVDELSVSEEINAFPNPANSAICVELPNEAETTAVELFNMSGQVVVAKTFSGKSTWLELGNLSQGMYLLRIRNAEKCLTRKVVLN
ncbi:MAG: T9SS type A sorting domain-containing protein [Bacteroidales bacterium]|nr:T9SS type A sorting domain-containing protein [Bacteroidales bacterium]